MASRFSREQSKARPSSPAIGANFDSALAVLAFVLVLAVLLEVLGSGGSIISGAPIAGALRISSHTSVNPSSSLIVASAPFSTGAPSGLIETGRVDAYDGTGTRAWEHWGSANYHYMGYSLAVGGNVNGDSSPEVIVGAPWYPQTHGRVDILSGANGSSLCNVSPPPSLYNSFFGASVSASANLNGDGIPDYLVGAPLDDLTTTGSNDGRAYGISGSGCGIFLQQTGIGSDDHFGKTVLTSPSLFLDGDSLNDYFVGAVLFNPPHPRIGTVYAMSSASSTPLWSRDGQAGDHYFGHSMAILPDVDGDGIKDLLVGAPGSILVGGSGLSTPGYVEILSGANGNTLIHLDGEHPDDLFGYSVTYVGDNDSDGHPEFAVSAPNFSTSAHPYEGKVYVFELASPSLATPQWSTEGEHAGDFFGFSIAGVKDADLDGQHELVVGAPYFDGAAGTNSGKIYDYRAGNGTLDWSVEGSTAGGGPAQGHRFGYAVAGTPII